MYQRYLIQEWLDGDMFKAMKYIYIYFLKQKVHKSIEHSIWEKKVIFNSFISGRNMVFKFLLLTVSTDSPPQSPAIVFIGQFSFDGYIKLFCVK